MMWSVKELKLRYYADRPSPFQRFNALVGGLLLDDQSILHAGCGADASLCLRGKSRFVVGIDLDRWISQNPDLDGGIIGALSRLPLANESMDLVICRWVVEHLENPADFFSEVCRVLRPGGHLTLLTPNLWNYASLAIRLTPHSFHRWFVKNLLKGEPHDAFPVFYRANTVSSLQSMGAEFNLQMVHTELVQGAPTLMSFSLPTYWMGIAYERIVNGFEVLAPLREAILVTFLKP